MDNRFNNYPENFNNPPRNLESDRKETVFSEPAKRIKNFFKFHWNEFKYGLTGLIIAILFLTLGFWRTILIILLVLLGKMIGQVKDNNPRILFFLRRMFNKY
ncbi:DUF2273 domain-containing protein [Lagierella massiliensis]|uniref:DUF2273 domain-containing protein n=1 Tax=Lagierella massiliensis TaxID=1689303 RepID=UPI0009EAF283|nr:DUF2273 domain-containing protein [Lagierella massiliensis]